MLNEEAILLERLRMRKKHLDLWHACSMSARIQCAGDGSHGLGRSRALVRINVKLIVILHFCMRQCGAFVASGVRPQLPSSIGSLHGLAGILINALKLGESLCSMRVVTVWNLSTHIVGCKLKKEETE